MAQGFAKKDFADPGYQDWTPTYANLTVGNGTVTARYIQIGTLVHVYWRMVLGSTSVIGTAPTFSMPVAAGTGVADNNQTLGRALMSEAGVGNWNGSVRMRAGDLFQVKADDASNTYARDADVTATVPLTWAADDVFSFIATYEAATSALIEMGANNDHGALSGLTDDDHSAYPAYGEWADWSPTLTNITIGNGTQFARYTQIGKTVHVWFHLTFGSSTSMDGSPSISLPVTANTSYPSTVHPLGSCILHEGGSTRKIGAVIMDDGNSQFDLFAQNANSTYAALSGITFSVPFTWGTNDVVAFTATYEAATAV